MFFTLQVVICLVFTTTTAFASEDKEIFVYNHSRHLLKISEDQSYYSGVIDVSVESGDLQKQFFIGSSFILRDLKPKTDLFEPDFVHEIRSTPNGKHASTSANINDFSCIQHGSVMALNNNSPKTVVNFGSCVISTCGDRFSAQLYLDNATEYEIKSLDLIDWNTPEKSLVFSASLYETDALKEEWSCGHEDGEHAHDHLDIQKIKETFRNLQSKAEFQVSKQSGIKYIKLLVVNDHPRFLERRGSTATDAAEAVSRMQALYNRFNERYRQEYPNNYFEIRISIARMITFAYGDPWETELVSFNKEKYALSSEQSQYRNGYRRSIDAGILLSLFNEWRTLELSDPNFPEHSVGHLITGNDLVGSTVGLANLFSVCRKNIASAINQGYDLEDDTLATIMAHELAHNLGVYHTNQVFQNTLVDSECGGFIMDPDGIRKTQWSRCSINFLKMNLEGFPYGCEGNECVWDRRYAASGGDACLEEKATLSWSIDPVCGNGLREQGEQCDCGQSDCSEIDPCCEGATCTFKLDRYECSALDPCCDKDTCQIYSSEQDPVVCREAVGECDVEEVCDGQHAYCPNDNFAPTGSKCQSADVDGSCYAGECHSHKEQCLEQRGFGFDGSCKSRNSNDEDDSCGFLYCHPAGTADDVCRRVETSGYTAEGQYLNVHDGTPCGRTEDGGYKVCDSFKGKCVDPDELGMPISLTCYNGYQDSDETDIDCGGEGCPACNPGDTCLYDSDCVNNECVGSAYTMTIAPTISEYEQTSGDEEFVEHPDGCTSLKDNIACGDWSGCIWLEEFTRCKPTGHFPPTGVCYTQKKIQTCINWQMCEWDSDSSSCMQRAGEPPKYGRCFGSLGVDIEENQWDIWVERLNELMNSGGVISYLIILALGTSTVLCVYSVFAKVTTSVFGHSKMNNNYYWDNYEKNFKKSFKDARKMKRERLETLNPPSSKKKNRGRKSHQYSDTKRNDSSHHQKHSRKQESPARNIRKSNSPKHGKHKRSSPGKGAKDAKGFKSAAGSSTLHGGNQVKYTSIESLKREVLLNSGQGQGVEVVAESLVSGKAGIPVAKEAPQTPANKSPDKFVFPRSSLFNSPSFGSRGSNTDNTDKVGNLILEPEKERKDDEETGQNFLFQ